jgi:hypothetical protein
MSEEVNYTSVEYNGDQYKVLITYGVSKDRVLISKDGKTKVFGVPISECKKLKKKR